MLTIDGSRGEGGGQILRSSLTLSLLTGKPFRIVNIRAGRKKPGLLRQHLAALKAAAQIGQAGVSGASPGKQPELGEQALTFYPGEIAPGNRHFSIGSAGSATLVLQTVLLPLLTAPAPSRLVFEGGTHNPFAPPFDFLQKAFLPLLERMGARVSAKLERPGFYPAGGGKFSVVIQPISKLNRIDLPERGKLLGINAKALISQLPLHVARRELKVVAEKLSLQKEQLAEEEVLNPQGPGNVLIIEIASEQVREIFTGFGEKRVAAEQVAAQAAEAAQNYLESGAAVGQYLADQLLLPFALAGGGSFSTLPFTSHFETNLDVLRRFMDIDVSIEQTSETTQMVHIG